MMRKLLGHGQREDRNLVFLMLGCALIFLSQIPVIVRSVEMGSPEPFQALLGGVIMAWLFVAPLVLYAIAALSHLLAKVFRGRGAFFSARLALFWALFAASPLWLFAGLLRGYLGQEAGIVQVVDFVAMALFAHIWIGGLIETEWGSPEVTP